MTESITMRSFDDDSGEVMIYGDIGDFFDDGISAKGFDDELKSLGKKKHLSVRINSVGGDVFTAVAIYNILTRHQARKVVEIDGVAASSASLIAMAGDTIRMAENALFMIHDPFARAMGTARELRERADRLDKVESAVRGIYAKRSGQSDEAIDSMMQSETWMEASEALAAGFIDEISSAQRVAACVPKDMFRHTPPRVIERREPTALAAYKLRVAKCKG